jgi:hypothetical protein
MTLLGCENLNVQPLFYIKFVIILNDESCISGNDKGSCQSKNNYAK